MGGQPCLSTLTRHPAVDSFVGSRNRVASRAVRLETEGSALSGNEISNVHSCRAKASTDDVLNAFVGHGRADISTRTLLAAFSISFAAANQARTSLSRLARIACSWFCSASIKA
jgi:hypothetical protein